MLEADINGFISGFSNAARRPAHTVYYGQCKTAEEESRGSSLPSFPSWPAPHPRDALHDSRDSGTATPQSGRRPTDRSWTSSTSALLGMAGPKPEEAKGATELVARGRHHGLACICGGYGGPTGDRH